MHFVKGSCRLPKGGLLLPSNFRENHVLLGDKGFLSYGAPSVSSVQEQRNQIRVAGFYDPGIMSVGARFILAESDIVHHINQVSQNVVLDSLLSNGIQVWFKDLKQANAVAHDIEKAFKDNEIDSYWKITPFYEYDFAKDLMSQFKSDRYLFIIIGVIILFVACCNIISLLLLLVNDKKHEIGILLSLGAKKRSIASIFGICGGFMGLLSCIIGCIAAYFTLRNMDVLVGFLNLLEGQQAFNSAFYGDTLPNELSRYALIFILVATPILSFIAGLIPAIKACRLRPSAILRSE